VNAPPTPPRALSEVEGSPGRPALLSLWAPVILWMGVIFFISSIPHLKSPFEWDYLYRKAAHVAEYVILAVLLCRAWRGSGVRAPAYVLLALGTAVLYAMTDEFHQGFVPGRTASALDVLIDSTGCLAGIFLYRSKTGNIGSATESS
jgi:VanZ family protein